MIYLLLKYFIFSNAFDGLDIEVPIAEIEIYLQILKPAYILSLSWQKDTCSIVDLNIGLTKYIFDLKRFAVSGEAAQLCKILSECIKQKFHYELTSTIYKVI